MIQICAQDSNQSISAFKRRKNCVVSSQTIFNLQKMTVLGLFYCHRITFLGINFHDEKMSQLVCFNSCDMHKELFLKNNAKKPMIEESLTHFQPKIKLVTIETGQISVDDKQLNPLIQLKNQIELLNFHHYIISVPKDFQNTRASKLGVFDTQLLLTGSSIF